MREHREELPRTTVLGSTTAGRSAAWAGVAATSETLGDDASVPSSVTRARDRTTDRPETDPELGQRRDEVLQDRGIDSPTRSQVVGHQPRERALQPLGRHGLGHLRHPLDPVAQQLDVLRTSAAIRSTMAFCWIGSSRPTAPKSINPSVPPSSTNTLPGWGSAWKNPTVRTCSSIDRSRSSASAARS